MEAALSRCWLGSFYCCPKAVASLERLADWVNVGCCAGNGSDERLWLLGLIDGWNNGRKLSDYDHGDCDSWFRYIDPEHNGKCDSEITFLTLESA